MPLDERDRARLRNVLETVMRADDTVLAISDARALSGPTSQDADLDALHEALTEALARLEALLGGR